MNEISIKHLFIRNLTTDTTKKQVAQICSSLHLNEGECAVYINKRLDDRHVRVVSGGKEKQVSLLPQKSARELIRRVIESATLYGPEIPQSQRPVLKKLALKYLPSHAFLV